MALNLCATLNVIFKLPVFDRFFCPDKKDKRTIWCAQHTVDFIDADVAVFGGFLDG